MWNEEEIARLLDALESIAASLEKIANPPVSIMPKTPRTPVEPIPGRKGY
jgi:hypothetical protein